MRFCQSNGASMICTCCLYATAVMVLSISCLFSFLIRDSIRTAIPYIWLGYLVAGLLLLEPALTVRMDSSDVGVVAKDGFFHSVELSKDHWRYALYGRMLGDPSACCGL